jgi:hypothetical protein
MKKFKAEASFDACKSVLGWEINTRSFTIHLQENKFISWCTNIGSIISNKKSCSKSLHTIEGQLSRAAYIIPTMHHFRSRLQALCMIAEQKKKQCVHRPPSNTNNKQSYFMQKNLYWAKNGISINLVSFRTPTLDYRSDACKYGLGGYNIYAERAWRLQIPQECIGHAHINTLEFMASVISISIDNTIMSAQMTAYYHKLIAQQQQDG